MPPTESSAATLPAPALPVPLTRFIGRERELSELTRLLASSRLLTLTGAGGSGKTRLAREAAAQAAQGFSRVIWADLAPLVDPHLVPQPVAVALGQVERPGQSPIELVRTAIGAHPILLILDNCEHVVDACAGFVESLLLTCPGLVVLATSREALGVPGETAVGDRPHQPRHAELNTCRATA